MSYQEQYQKLIGELAELEDKKMELSQIYSKKLAQKNKMDLEYRETDQTIEELESKKETMLYSKKINRLSSLYAILPVAISITILVLSTILSSICFNDAIKYMCYDFLITLPIAAVGAIISIAIGKKIISKEFNKIENSVEYKKVLNDIQTKKAEKEKLTNDFPKTYHELETTLVEFNAQKSLVDLKIKEIDAFRDEVFYSVVDAPIQSTSKNKPYTRIKTK